MKKTFLIVCLLTILGMVSASAATALTIKVDNAANVTVTPNNGTGTAMNLQDGLNTFSVESSQNPFLVKATPGAEIVTVMANGNEVYDNSNTGEYRFGVGGPTYEVEITTSGNGSGSEDPEVASTNFNIFAVGDGVKGAPYTVAVLKGEEWIAPEAGDFGMGFKVPEGAMMKITPVFPYEIVNATVPYSQVTIDYTREEDGSIVFANVIPDYYNLNLEMKISDSALTFTIQVDYPGNVNAFMEWQRNGTHDWEYLNIADGVNQYAVDPEANPLEIMPIEGGEIIQVTRNGVVTNPIGWDGSGGYLFTVEKGDAFNVITKGPEMEMVVKMAANNTAKLDDFFFTKSDGSVIKLTGTEDKISGNQGEFIYVSPRPGTIYTMIFGENGAVTDMQTWKDWFRITPGADGTNPASVTLYGARDIQGVVIDVDNASRVSVVQAGGRGDALTLSSGVNNFALDNIQNALAISATDGNQVVRVTLNGDLQQVNAQGVYLVSVAESDYVNIYSRKAPIDANLTFAVNEGADLNWLKVKVNGQEVETVSPLTVKSYSVVSLSAAPGYVLETVSSNQSGITIGEIDGTFELTVANADITAATISVVLKEVEPEEGYAIVVPNGDEWLISFTELRYIADEDRYAKVKSLTNNTVNQVEIGNFVEVYRNDSMTEYSYVKVNGEDVADLSSRAIRIEIKGRTVIDAEVFTQTYTYTNETYDEVKHVVSGTIEFEVNGERVSHFNAEPGMTVKLIALPSMGYVFDHFELFYPLTPNTEGIRLDSDTYTFTAEDCENEFLLFKGVFNVDDNMKTYVVRGSTAWLVDEEGNVDATSSSAMGTVVFLANDGSYVYEVIGIEGDPVHLEIEVLDPEIFANYETAGFALRAGFPNKVIPADYTINPADADAEGVIWVCGIVRKKGSGVNDIENDGFRYDAAGAIIVSAEPVKVFDINGNLEIDAPAGAVSVETLPSGIHIAVGGGKAFKFVRK